MTKFSSVSFFFSMLKISFTKNKLILKLRRCKFFLVLLKLLYNHGYILYFRFDLKNDSLKNHILVFLKYNSLNSCLLQNYKIYSKPSRKVYLNLVSLKQLFKSGSFVVISTSKGVLTLEECLLNNIGGEVLFVLD